jgi:GTP1/Obg family GTP-binding protein
MTLNTQPNLARPDDFYEALIDMHRDFDEAQSQLANAQLILLLANHIGDHATLLEAMQHARAGTAQVGGKQQGAVVPLSA